MFVEKYICKDLFQILVLQSKTRIDTVLFQKDTIKLRFFLMTFLKCQEITN